MKKLLLKSILLLCTLVVGTSAWADNVTFVFNTDAGLTQLGITKPDTGAGTDLGDDEYSISPITMTATDGGTHTRVWNSGGNTTLRVYGNNTKQGSLTFSTTSTYRITAVALGAGTWTSSVGTMSLTNWSGSAESVSFTASANATINTIAITYQDISDTRAATTVTISGNETSRYMDQSATTPTAVVKVSSTSAVIDGANVTWSSTVSSVASINESTGVITLHAPGTTTIEANYAGTVSDYKPSNASYTLKVYGVFDEISDLQTAIENAPYNTGSGSNAKVTFTNAIVNHATTNYAYIIDENGYGAVINQNSHGFTAGKIINGTVTGATLCKYSSGATVLKNITSSTTGLTLTDGSVTTLTKTIDEVSSANQSMMVKFENVTYNASSSLFTDNTNSIAFDDFFNVNPTLADGGKYDVTGILLMDDGVLKVAPIADAGIVSKLINPTSQWKNGETQLTTITINKAEGTKSFTFETNSDGNLTYTSTNTNVATIAANGTITPLAYGTTTIKANTTSTSTYNADEQSFTLHVGDAGVDVIVIDNVTFAGNSGYQNWTNVSNLTTTASYAGQSMTGQNYIQIRNQSPSGIVSTASAGRIKKIMVTWAGSNTNNRYLTIYGKNSAYSAPSELYGDNKGEELGTITFTTESANGELTIDNKDNYGYIGIKASGAMYIGVLAIEWEEDKFPIAPAKTYTTLTSAKNLDFTSVSSDIKAYIATEVSGGAVQMTQVNKVPAGTGLVLKATTPGAAVNVPVFDGTSPDDVSGNKMVGSATSTTAIAENGGYILSNGAFHPATAGTLAAGKAYLNISVSARELELSFDESDVTAISEVTNTNRTNNTNVYDLQGRKVAQPTNGLYIVNGKKVIVK